VPALHVVDLLGVATRLSDHKPFSFGAIVTITGLLEFPGARLQPATTPGLPGQYPICKQRILELDLPSGLRFFQGGKLEVTIDPRAWFQNYIDFADGLEPSSSGDCQPDATANATYENGKSCSDGAACDDGFVCNPEDHHCIAASCIPDTNYPELPTASSGPIFFSGIQTGGSEAYNVVYSK
jgi:hypothetical protein